MPEARGEDGSSRLASGREGWAAVRDLRVVAAAEDVPGQSLCIHYRGVQWEGVSSGGESST